METLKGEQVKNLFRNTLSQSKKQRFKTLTYSPVKVRHGPASHLKQLFVANPAAISSSHNTYWLLCLSEHPTQSEPGLSEDLIVDAAPAN